MKKNAIVYTDSGSIALVINSVRREGDKLVIDGKALGEMRMDMVLRLPEVFNIFKIIFCWEVVIFILLVPFFYFNRVVMKRR
ncbi:hypothetical protein ACFLTP_01520 [Chloroflexota bacterium]